MAPRWRMFLRRITRRRGPRSVRLTFEYDDTGQLRVVRRTTRPKPAPPGDDLDRDPRPDQIWVEVRAQNGRRLYRKVLRDPLQQTAEVFHPDGRITRVPTAPGRGVFTVVVPDERRPRWWSSLPARTRGSRSRPSGTESADSRGN